MANIRESGEDYLETILSLEKSKNVVRSSEIAERLSVSRPSVNRAINVLREAGMVEQERYGTIRLTDAGRKRAEEVMAKHLLIYSFLHEGLGVSAENAAADACRIEHIVSEETVEAIRRFKK